MMSLVLAADRAVFAGMRIEAGDGEPRPGDAEARRADRARRCAPVATISSVVSAAGTSASGMWMVTGTVRSSGPASIITGVTVLPVVAAREMGEVFGVAGKAEAGVVEHLLGDRSGDDRGGAAGEARRRRRGRSIR